MSEICISFQKKTFDNKQTLEDIADGNAKFKSKINK